MDSIKKNRWLYALGFFLLCFVISTIVLAVLYEKERDTSKRVAPNELQRYITSTGVGHMKKDHHEKAQSEHSFLHFIAQITGWENKFVEKSVIKKAPKLENTDFFSLYPYEMKGVDCFNPTYIESHDIFIMRTDRQDGTEKIPGYKYVNKGPFQADTRLQDLNVKCSGEHYIMKDRTLATRRHPVIEDIRYVGQHKPSGRVFLSGTAIVGDVRKGFIRIALIEYHHQEKTLETIYVFPSPNMTIEKNWMFYLHPNKEEIEFDILYSFHKSIEVYHFKLGALYFQKMLEEKAFWPKPYSNHDTKIRGSALMKLPEGGFLLLVHRRSPKMYYYYYAALLSDQYELKKVISMPVFLERPFRITFIMNLYVKDGVLCVTAGIEDRISCIFTYRFSEFMSLFDNPELLLHEEVSPSKL